jgi:hypothetical protein
MGIVEVCSFIVFWLFIVLYDATTLQDNQESNCFLYLIGPYHWFDMALEFSRKIIGLVQILENATASI